MLDTVIKLEKDDLALPEQTGARFDLSFTKTRGEIPQPPVLKVSLMNGPDGFLVFASQNGVAASRPMQMLKMIHDKKPEKQKELAKMMGVTTGAISQHKTKLIDMGLLNHTDAGFKLTRGGLEALAGLWPEYQTELMLGESEGNKREKIPY